MVNNDTDKDNVGAAVIIPHPSAVDTKRPVSVNVSEPVATDEYRLPQMSDGGTNVTVSYSLWIGSNITEKRSINITADHNVTFYEIMQRASDLDSAFTYVTHEQFIVTYMRCQISILYIGHRCNRLNNYYLLLPNY